MKEKNFKILIYIIIIIILLIILGIILYNSLPTPNSTNTTNQIHQENLNNTYIENENIADSYIEYSQDTTLVKDGFGEKVNASNTINYVLLKKYGYDETVLEKYYSQGIIQGDSPNYEIIESNYKNNIGKYTEKINFNMAIVKDFLYPDNNDTLANNLKIFKPLLLKEREQWQNEQNIYGNGNSIPELYVSLNGFSIINGNNTNNKSYYDYSRVKKIKVIINDSKTYTFELKDTNDVQLFDLNYKQTDIGKPINVKFEVLESYKGSNSNDIYIHEIGFGIIENGFGGR